MILSSLDDARTFAPDVTIVGGGHAGLALALELDRLGQRVLVLESGVNRASSAHQNLALADQIDLKRHDDMAIATARRLGGTSNLWGTRCQPLDPIDFTCGRSYCKSCWPIDQNPSAPWNARAAELLAIGAPAFSEPVTGLEHLQPEFEIAPQERFSNDPAMQSMHRKALISATGIGILLDATMVDARLDEGRISEIEVAGLKQESGWLPVERLVLAAGGIETTRLLLWLQRHRSELAGGPDNALGRYYMGHIIGEVADVILDNKVLDKALDFRIDAHGTYARHRLVPSDALQHAKGLPNVAFWPVVPPISDARHRDGVLSLVYLIFAFKPIGSLLVAEAIRIRHVPPGTPLWPHLRNILTGLPRVIAFAPTFAWRRFVARVKMPGFFLRNPGRRYGLSYHAEQSPRADSRITLSDKRDPLGLPRVNIDLRFAREDAEALLETHRELDAWLRQQGLGRIEYHQPENETVDAILEIAAHGTHQIGTARMAASAEEGCVDENLKVFGSDNLWICSSAAFPTSGQCNPTFSIVAFACRLAAHLAS
jgi:choline dehydrogenase-like flavoprotein